MEREVAELQSLVEARRFADAWKKGSALKPQLELAPTDLAARAMLLVTAAGLEIIGPAAAFKGVATRDKDLVVVSYEFSDARWKDDFQLVSLLPAIKTRDKLERTVQGTVALCHSAIWADPVSIEIEGRPDIATDFGPVLIDPDETATERFLTGFHNNAYFGIKYEADRSVTQGHVLLLAGRGAVSRAKTRPTQLLGMSPTPVIARGSEVRCSLSVNATKAEFKTATSPTSTATLTFELAAATQTFPRIRAGLLVRDSAFEISRVIIRGRLDPAWVNDETARLREAVKSIGRRKQ